MKKAQLQEQIISGKILTVGRFVDFKKDVVAYRDRKTGQPATFNKVEYAVKTALGVVFVQPDTRKIPGFSMDTFKCPFEMGDAVVIEIQSMVTERGITTIGGTVEKLEA